MLNEIILRKTNIWYHVYVESKKSELVETYYRIVVTRDWGMGEIEKF